MKLTITFLVLISVSACMNTLAFAQAKDVPTYKASHIKIANDIKHYQVIYKIPLIEGGGEEQILCTGETWGKNFHPSLDARDEALFNTNNRLIVDAANCLVKEVIPKTENELIREDIASLRKLIEDLNNEFQILKNK